MTQPVVGIDIAKDSFDAALMVGEKRWNEHFENNGDGFRRMSKWVKKQTQEQVHACMEATGQYGDALAEYLHAQGWQVSVVNPARIKAYGQCKLRRNKTDKADAQLIALYCLHEEPTLWTPPPASFKALQSLTRRFEDLQANYQQENNRLKSGQTNPQVLEDIRGHLSYLKERIVQIKQMILKHIAENPELKCNYDLLISIPGVGPLTAGKVLGEVRDVNDFDDARQLAAYAGVTPQNFVSGTSVHKKARMSKIGNSRLRKDLYMPAISAKHHNPIVMTFCQRLEEAGLKPLQVIGAAMHKLLHLIYGVLKSRKPFDPNFLQKQAIAS
jgi:transposase